MSRGIPSPKLARLSSKILLAIGSVLFLFALVVGFNFYILIMPNTQGSAQQASQSALLAEQMKTSLVEAQKNESLFLLNPDSKTVAKHKTSITNIVGTSRKFAQNARQAGDDASVAAAGKINNAVQQLDAAFLELVQAREKKGLYGIPGLLENLNKAGRDLVEIISRNEAGSLTLAFLEIKHHENDYLGNGRNSELRNLQAAIKNFSRLLMNTKIDPVEAQVLRKGTREYNSALDRYQAVSLATNDPTLSVTLGKERERQADAMRSAANNIQSIISRVNVPNALSLVQTTRRHEAEYLLTKDPKYSKLANDSLATLSKAFNNSSILQEHKNQALKASSQYQEALNSLVNQDTLIAAHKTNVNKAGASLSTLLNNTAKAASARTSGNALSLPVDGNNLGMVAGIAGLVVILIGILVAVMLGKSISAPISSITQILKRIINERDFNVEIPVNSNNEIGDLAQELNKLLSLMREASMQTDESSSELTQKANLLSDIAQKLQLQITQSGEENDKIGTSLATLTEQSADLNSSVKTLSESRENMGQMFSKSDEQNLIITNAVEKIEQSFDETLEGIKAITKSSSQISDIITLSTEIAEQTNLLALNASVKAARAGSHGKEFVLIADEIAKLAQRSEEIAKETGQLTVTLTSNVDEAVKLGDESKQSLDQILQAGKLNLQTTEELTSQAQALHSSMEKIDELAKEVADSASDIASSTAEQNTKLASTRETVDELLQTTGSSDQETHNDIDVTASVSNHAVDNIAITSGEPENDFDSEDGHFDDTEEVTTGVEVDETGTVDSNVETTETASDDGNEEPLVK